MRKTLRTRLALALSILLGLSANGAPGRKKKAPEPSPLDTYVNEATNREDAARTGSPGSLWRPGAALGNLGVDLRALQVDDIVTILVVESASAISTGQVKTQRASEAHASVDALGKKISPSSSLANLMKMSSNVALDGQGSTGRQTSLTTAMTARVTKVLPNGYLVVEGKKTVKVNAEQQTVMVRGVVRPIDLSSDNSVPSDRLAQMELSVDGKGVVGDTIRRPNALYRLLLGILPF